jgi:hypothetical protein
MADSKVELDRLKRRMFPKVHVLLRSVGYAKKEDGYDTNININMTHAEFAHVVIRKMFKTGKHMWFIPTSLPGVMRYTNDMPICRSYSIRVDADIFDVKYGDPSVARTHILSSRTLNTYYTKNNPADPFKAVYGVYKHMFPLAQIHTKDQLKYLNQYTVGRIHTYTPKKKA